MQPPKMQLPQIEVRGRRSSILAAGSAVVDSVTSVGQVLWAGGLDSESARRASVASAIETPRGGLQQQQQQQSHEEGSEELRTGFVPLLHGIELELDDKGAAVVMVFPREVAGDRLVAAPGEKLSKVFKGRAEYLCPEAQRLFDAGGSCCGGEQQPLDARSYERIVRSELASVLADAGLRTKTRESIGKDAVFVLVSLPRDGAAIRRMARTYSYRLPLKRSAYEQVGETIMTDESGEEVPLYMAYEGERERFLKSFSSRDEILIAMRRLDELIDFNELSSQGVMSKHFPAARHKSMMHLHMSWSRLSNMFFVPPHICHMDSGSAKRAFWGCLSASSHYPVINDVKDYYGEEVAFFYAWLARFVLWLMPLALISSVVAAIRRGNLLSKSQDRKIRLSFACVMLLWSCLFNKFWSQRDAHLRQAWGLTTSEATIQTCSKAKSYKPKLNGTKLGKLKKNLSYACPVVYILLFIYIDKSTQLHFDEKHSDLRNWSPTVLIFLFKNIWNKLVPHVVDLQNHATQANWNDALTWFLAPVKLIITVVPFLHLMFFQTFTGAQTLSLDSPQYKKVIDHIQGNFLASELGCHHIARDVDRLINLLTHEGFHRLEGDQATFNGCLPVVCQVMRPDIDSNTTDCNSRAQCDNQFRFRTDCLQELESRLFAFYAIISCSMLIDIILPIMWARFRMQREIIKETIKAERMTALRYSFIQVQAKCFDVAQYAYGSSGGSWVDNFMHPAIVFLHLQCFSVVAPVLALLAFVTLLLEYRLMAYRHNNLTCRNWPYASQGIGAWTQIFQYCTFIGVSCIICKLTLHDGQENVFGWIGQVIGIDHVFHTGPGEDDYTLKNFIVLQTVMVAIHVVVGLTIPDQPEHVERIAIFNASIKEKLLRWLEREAEMVQSTPGKPEVSLDDAAETKRALVAGLGSPVASDAAAADSDFGPSSSEEEDTEGGGERGCLFGGCRRAEAAERIDV